jgi:hypothetical protein
MDQQQLARIRLLSRRFLELQGLRVAFAGGTIATVMAIYLIVAVPTPSGPMIAMLVALALMIPGQVWLHRYYATTFGRQVPKRRDPRLLLALLPFQLLLLMFTIYLNRRFPEIPAGAPTTAFFSTIAVLVAIRDWPWRAYYLGVPVAVASAWSANAFGDGPFDAGMTLAVTFLVTGLSLIAVGLLDHWLLVRLTQEARAPHAVAVENGSGSEM